MKKSPYFKSSINIESLSSKGYGLGFLKKTETSPLSKVVVPGTLPGDEVVADVGPKRQGVYFGKLLEILEPSLDRVTPRCIHAGSCGGCSLQQMSYESQLAHKETIVKDLFAPLFAGVPKPILPSDPIWHYRNKMEYTFSQDKEGNRFLGLIIAASKGRVEPLTECHLSPKWFITLLEGVRKWWEESTLLAYNGFRNTGSLRTLTVREGRRTGQKMAILTVSGCPEYSLTKEHLNSFVTAAKAAINPLGENELVLFLRVQQIAPGMVTQFYEMQLLGPAHIGEELDISVADYQKKYQFKISPTAFFQPNTCQAEKLYSKALEMAGLKKRKTVFDLYAGTATLGMIFSAFAEKVIAIEINPYAVFDAEMNKEINQIANLDIFKGDVAEALRELRKQDTSLQGPDLVLLDPPRTGLSKEALDIVVQLAPLEIVYISCAPQTQAKDCGLFKEAGYEIIDIQPVDQFPHTAHIENIVLLRQKSILFS